MADKLRFYNKAWIFTKKTKVKLTRFRYTLSVKKASVTVEYQKKLFDHETGLNKS